MNDINKGIIVFSGYNQRAVIAFCRFAEEYKIKYFIVAKDNEDEILLSNFKKNVVEIRKDKNLDTFSIIKICEKIKEKQNIKELVILPSTEFLVRFLNENKSVFEKENIIIPTCEEKLYSLVSDKYAFGELCKKYNIAVPMDIDFPKKYLTPFVAKPITYFSPAKKVHSPYIINSLDSYKDFCEIDERGNFYFQEYVEGRSIYLLFYFAKTGEYSVYSQENFIQQSGGKSIIAAESSLFHTQEIANQFADMFINEGFKGLVMVEIKVNNDKNHMIEANPRLWGPSQLILDSGMDLFERFAYDLKLIKNKKQLTYKSGVKYFWSEGLQNQKGNLKFHNYSKEQFQEAKNEFFKNDIYAKQDTENIMKGMYEYN